MMPAQSTIMASHSPTTFQQFAQLPTEIQILIWTEAFREATQGWKLSRRQLDAWNWPNDRGNSFNIITIFMGIFPRECQVRSTYFKAKKSGSFSHVLEIVRHCELSAMLMASHRSRAVAFECWRDLLLCCDCYEVCLGHDGIFSQAKNIINSHLRLLSKWRTG